MLARSPGTGEGVRLRFGIRSRLLLATAALGSLFLLYVAFSTARQAVGDELLKIAAERLATVVRGSDTVARLAGDEFTVILEGLTSVDDARAVAAKLVALLHLPMRIGAAEVAVSASIGVAMLEAGERDPASLLRRADEALYEAKRRGRNRFATRPAGVA